MVSQATEKHGVPPCGRLVISGASLARVLLEAYGVLWRRVLRSACCIYGFKKKKKNIKKGIRGVKHGIRAPIREKGADKGVSLVARH